MNALAIVATIASLIALGLAVLLALRTRQAFRTGVLLKLGMASILRVEEQYARLYSRAQPLTMLFLTDRKLDCEVIFLVPFVVTNRSRNPVHNLQLQLEYPVRHMIPNEELPRIPVFLERERGGVRFKDPGQERTVQQHQGVGIVLYHVPILRPGEELVMGDVIRFSTGERDLLFDKDPDQFQWVFPRSLQQTEDFLGGTLMVAFLRSEECRPIKRRFKILWATSNGSRESDPELAVLKAFWDGKTPTPGLYLRNLPWRQMHSNEYVESVHLPLVQAGQLGQHNQFVADFDLARRRLVRFGFPPWNYLGKTEAALEADALFRRAGFLRVGPRLQKGAGSPRDAKLLTTPSHSVAEQEAPGEDKAVTS